MYARREAKIYRGPASAASVGAYTQAVLTGMGWPFALSLACAAGLSAAVGVVVGLPALRVKGIYLGMATLSFGFIVEEVAALHGGTLHLDAAALGGLRATVRLPADRIDPH